MKPRKVSRREFAAALAAPTLARPAGAADAEDLGKEAAGEREANAAALDKVSMPMGAEPSFVFRTL